jgi:hypothetical protein
VPPHPSPLQSSCSKPEKAFSRRKSGNDQNVDGCCNWDTISDFAFCNNQLRLHGRRITFRDDDPYAFDLIALGHNRTVSRGRWGRSPIFPSILLPNIGDRGRFPRPSVQPPSDEPAAQVFRYLELCLLIARAMDDANEPSPRPVRAVNAPGVAFGLLGWACGRGVAIGDAPGGGIAGRPTART